MLTDYKITHLTRCDDGSMGVAVRFYAGEVTTEDEYDGSTEHMAPVTRYRRTLALRERVYGLQAMPDDGLRRYLSEILAQDVARQPIPEQV